MWMRTQAAFIAALFVGGCANPGQNNFLRGAEIDLETDTALYQKRHRTVHYPTGLTLNFSGYLIGIEKSPRERIAADGEIKALFKPLSDHVSEEQAALDEVDRLLSERKAVYPTHILKYTPDMKGGIIGRSQPCLVYTAYGKPKELEGKMCPHGVSRTGAADAWRDGMNAIRRLRSSIADNMKTSRDAGRPVTHVLVYVMGWNTNQEEAVRNFNSLVGELLEAAPKEGSAEFHLLVIGVSWPSLWDWSERPILGGFDFLVKGLSYTTKANDADEVGLIPLNVLLHDVLRPIKSESIGKGVKVVVIGHSFGARVASRAVYSGDLLRDASPSNGTVDLLVGLQGAFSINRFIPDHSKEGAPYRNYRKVGRVVLTGSAADEVVKTSFWAATAGDIESYRDACRQRSDLFDCRSVDTDGQWKGGATAGLSDNRITYVDASDLIYYNASGTGGGAHSDIYRPQMGRFIWNLINTVS